MNNDTFTLAHLHANRDALLADWRTRVDNARRFGRDATTFSATGPILMRDNSLALFVRIDGERAYDLVIDAAGVVTEIA